MLPSWCQDSVTVLRAPIVTTGTRKTRDWENATKTTVTGCSLQPSTTETERDGAQRDASASTATLLCPYGTDIAEGDRIVAASRTWQVAGVPLGIQSPKGATSNLKVTLTEWRG